MDKAPVVIQKLQTAVQQLDAFMKSQGLDTAPEAVPNLKGDAARACFIERFKEVQRLKTQLDQYTDLTGEDKAAIATVLPEDQHRGFKGAYLETAQRLKEQQGKTGKDDQPGPDDTAQIDFEFVLFASAVIDYDYIMGLIARFSERGPGKSKMTREQLIGLISSDAKFMNERDDIAAYIGTLKAGEGLIRTKLLKDGHIDTVIGLPANLFYSTGIPVCILVLKKCKKPDDVLFINAAEHFVKGKRQNQLSAEHIAKIIATYQNRAEEPRYSRRVEMAEIEKNEFNLNISRYISTATAEEEIDLGATRAALVETEKSIQTAKATHNTFLRELGLAGLP